MMIFAGLGETNKGREATSTLRPEKVSRLIIRTQKNLLLYDGVIQQKKT